MRPGNSKASMLIAMCTLLIGGWFVAEARAQLATLEIRGVVKDERGALIAGANVTVGDKGRRDREAVSDEQGQFRITGLRSGAYVLKVSAKGFAAYEQSFDLKSREPAALSV